MNTGEQKKSDREAGADEELSVIVAWLRERLEPRELWLADALELKDHRRSG